MPQKVINILCLIFIITLSIYSCVDDDVCDQITTPRITIGLDSLQAKYSVKELYIDRINSDGTLLKSSFSQTDSVKVPLNLNSDETIFYLYRDSTIQDSAKDIITIKYQRRQEFVSKACGFKVTFHNITYELTRKKRIQAITPNTAEINDESQKNLFITY